MTDAEKHRKIAEHFEQEWIIESSPDGEVVAPEGLWYHAISIVPGGGIYVPNYNDPRNAMRLLPKLGEVSIVGPDSKEYLLWSVMHIESTVQGEGKELITAIIACAEAMLPNDEREKADA